MKNGRVFLDSFSGLAAELPRAKRTPADVLAALRLNPRVSTFDMSECPWLVRCIDTLKGDNKIVEDKNEPYPWHRYVVVEPDTHCMRAAQSIINAAQQSGQGAGM